MFVILCSVSMASDIDIQLSEKAISSFISAASPIKFKKEIKVMDRKTEAKFMINNLVINLKTDKIYVEGKLSLEMKESKLEASINGELEPTIDQKTGEMILKLNKVNIKGLEFLKLDEVLKDQVEIHLNISNLKPIKIKQSDTEYEEVIPKITNEKIEITEEFIKVSGDISFSKGKVKKY